jgi:sec-independent protein translocase protein TatB
MFDIDAGKLLIIGLVALVVIGPKDLPRVMRQVGQMITRLRKMAGEFQGQFMEAIKEADLQDLRDEVAKLKDSATLDVNFDPARDIRTELTKAVDGTAAPASAVAADADATALLTEPESPPVYGDRGGFSFPPPPAPEATLDPAAAGFAPTAEPMSTGLLEAAPPASPASDTKGEGVAEPGRRKVVIPRRRPASRFDAPPGGGPAPQRPRNILPPRRETLDR